MASKSTRRGPSSAKRSAKRSATRSATPAAKRSSSAASTVLPYEISDRVTLQAVARPSGSGYDSAHTRLLQIFTLDPSVSSLLGGSATVAVPFEELQPGPVGAVFEVDSAGMPAVLRPDTKSTLLLDLNERALLLANGLTPTPADGRFHLQMVYAVCSLTYAVFQRALGRDIMWASGYRASDDEPFRLKIIPFALRNERNAAFDQELGSISFGYFHADNNPGGHTVPHGLICTALSHDVVAHETTHALLHALRAQFATPSNPDVLGFHEGFADIVALLMHFSYPDVVLDAMRASRGSIANATLLTDLARQFGQATSKPGQPSALRSALDVTDAHAFDSDAFASGDTPGHNAPRPYAPDLEAHLMGSVLVSAVFEAFSTVLRRRSLRYFRIARLAPDDVAEADLTDDLVRALATEASDTAKQFLNICIRAIDFCPPVDIRLGEYLRALITADADAVSDDKYGYREALMRSFQRRHIFPDKLDFMSEDAVRWKRPPFDTPIAGLSLSDLRFGADLATPAGAEEMRRRATALGEFVSQPAIAKALHLVPVGASLPRNVEYAAPIRVESIRTTRRVTPDGRVTIELVAEVTQSCTVRVNNDLMDFPGGCTLIIAASGHIRYAIYKSVLSTSRPAAQHAAVTGPLNAFWHKTNGTLTSRPNMLAMLHRMSSAKS
jgi:hypothetical protein